MGWTFKILFRHIILSNSDTNLTGPKKCIKLYQFNTLFAFFIYKKGCRPNRKTILKCIRFNIL